MKNRLQILGLIFIISACSTATVAPAVIPSPSLTPFPTQTPQATVTPAETLVPAENHVELKPIYETEEIVETIDGVQIRTKIVTDKSVLPTIGKVIIHEGWKNQNGRHSEAAIAEFIAKSFYTVWAKDHKGKTYEEFMALWAAAQNGTGNWKDVDIKPFVNDTATEGYELKPTTLRPMFSGNTLDGVKEVENVVIAYVKENISITNVDLVDPDRALGGFGVGVNLDGNTLYQIWNQAGLRPKILQISSTDRPARRSLIAC